jgi:putative DNA primase/helicase
MNGGKSTMELAAEILQSRLANTRHWQGEFYRWTEGAYRPLEPTLVQREVYLGLEGMGLRPKARDVANVIDAMRAFALLDGSLVPPSWLDGSVSRGDVLVFRNGILETATGEFRPPSAQLFATTTLGVEFDPDATEPQEWRRFLAEISGNDQEWMDTLAEVFGYCLTDRTEQHKLFCLIGPPRSGKGTIVRVLTQLLGEGNVASMTLSRLAESFGMQSLIGRLVAVIPDARLSGRTDAVAVVERLLSISGEDRVPISRKYLPDYTSRLKSRFLLATNELPRLTDAAGALASRLVMLSLRQSFLGREDHGLAGRLDAELPGILLWAIEGLHRLNSRGRFLQPSSSAEALGLMEDLSSPIGAFIRDRCRLGPDALVPVDMLYGAYRQWCDDEGRAPSSRSVFGRDLMAAAPGVRNWKPRADGSRRPTYRGITLLGTGPGGPDGPDGMDGGSGPGGPAYLVFDRYREKVTERNREDPGPPGPVGPDAALAELRRCYAHNAANLANRPGSVARVTLDQWRDAYLASARMPRTEGLRLFGIAKDRLAATGAATVAGGFVYLPDHPDVRDG